MARSRALSATRPAPSRTGRAKLSTTVAADTFAYLEHKVAAGQASSIAEAVDASVRLARQMENRERLSRATARYFEQLEPHAAREEDELTLHLGSVIDRVDFDEEL
jgi:hypothetical protein